MKQLIKSKQLFQMFPNLFVLIIGIAVVEQNNANILLVLRKIRNLRSVNCH